MSEIATKDDINRIYDKLEPIAESLTRVETRLDLMPTPLKQPCNFLNSHLNDHKTTVKTWKSSVIRACVDMAKMGVVAALTYLWVTKK